VEKLIAKLFEKLGVQSLIHIKKQKLEKKKGKRRDNV
jgi:hypothetical protein